jgi:DHA2 family multidrug resistance protein
VIGGYILDTYESWPLLFYFKLPILIAGLVMALMWLPKDEPSGDTPPMQWTGLALLATGLATLQVVLSRGQQEDWFDSDRIVTFTVVALLAWLAFVVLQLRARRPFVNLRIFGTLSFSIGCIVTVVSGFGLYGINLVTPLFFQGPLGLTPYQSGIFLLQGSIATFVVIPFVGPLTRRIDARVVVGGGLLLFGIGAWMMGSLNAETGYWDLFVPRVLQGIGLGLMFAPLLAMTLAGIAPSEMSDATGIATLVRYLGGNIGIALLEVLQVRREDAVSASIAGSVTLQHPGAAELVRTMGLPHARMVLAAAEQANATLISYLYLFRLTAILFLATIALLAFLPNLRAARKAAPPKDVDVELAEELDEALEPQPQMALRSAQPAT